MPNRLVRVVGICAGVSASAVSLVLMVLFLAPGRAQAANNFENQISTGVSAFEKYAKPMSAPAQVVPQIEAPTEDEEGPLPEEFKKKFFIRKIHVEGVKSLPLA